MIEERVIQGRRFSTRDLDQIRGLLSANPDWSRWRLSREIAQRWQWYSLSGQLKDMAARTLLLKLDQQGWIKLPERKRQPARRLSTIPHDSLGIVPSESIVTALKELLPLQIVRVAPRQADYHLFENYLVHHHYLSYRGPVGENVSYLVRDRVGRELACVLFGAAAWKCAPRDRWIGWSAEHREQRLGWVANNTRFLILPWVRVKFLASHILGQIAKRIDADWQSRYAHGLHLLETFVQADRFRGTCYQAANWIRAGQTTGRTRQDRHNRINAPFKDIYLYPLGRRGAKELCKSNLN